MAVNNSITKKSASEVSVIPFQKLIKSSVVQDNITATLGDVAKTKSFTAALVSAVNNNYDLSKCSGMSIISAALLGESLKLSPSPQLGHYYMVPFAENGSELKKAQFQLGYKGYIQLAIRSGQYKRLNVVAVKEGELKGFDPFNEEIDVQAISDPDAREKAKTIGYYAMFETTNGFKKSMYWSKAKMEAHASKYSQGYRAHKGYTFWEKDFDGMAYKTMLRQLISKWGIMSIEMQSALSNDMSYKDSINPEDSPKYVDNDVTLDADVNEHAVNLDAETGEVIEETVGPEKKESPATAPNEATEETLY